MAYLGSWKIDDCVPIPVTTHQVSTGAAFAPTALTYSIYEDGSTTGIDEDVAIPVGAPFDGITGCYYVRRQLTTAAGFEKGKNYVCVIKTTVDGVSAVQMHLFQIENVAAEIADAVWDEALAGHDAAGATGAKLNDVQTLGPGATEWTYTLTSTELGNPPIADADVWVSTNAAGTNVIASGKTNANGEVTFYLDSGSTYYIFRQKSGWDFTNPDVETV